MNDYKVNDYITLKFEDGNTIIYVNGERFRQCKYLLLNIPVEHESLTDDIQSIDEAAEYLDESLKYRADLEEDVYPIDISPEVGFWAHCSNLQAWSENDYNTKILHSNLAFPLLKQLIKAGDKKASKAFKEEIAFRLESGYLPTIKYLWNEGFIKYLLREEPSIIPDLKYKELEHILAIEDFVNVKFSWADKQTNLNQMRVGFLVSEVHITEIHINYVSDLDVFPEPITNLKYLTNLMMYGNSIKSIHDNIGNLASLKFLDLSNNQLTKIPETIGKCKNLEILKLHGNLITELPQSIGNLTLLTKLDLSHNNLSQLPNSIGKLTNLKRLDLRRNKLGVLPISMESLQSLESLDLHNNKLKTIPETIGNLKSLKSLTISRNKLENVENFSKSLLKLGKLKYFLFDKNLLGQFRETIKKLEKNNWLQAEIDNGFPSSLRYLWNERLVKRFIREEPSVTPKFDYDEFENLFDIEDLVNEKSFWADYREDPVGKKVWFSGNEKHITELVLVDINELDIFPEPITKLRCLTKLTLNGTSIKIIPDTICNLRSLEYLNLSLNKIIELPETISYCKNLKVLKLSGNVITQLPKSIGNLTLLKQLDLSDNKLFQLPDSIENLENLKVLNLMRNKLKALPISIENLHSLKTLNIQKNRFNSIPESIAKLKSLKSLSISGNQLENISENLLNFNGLIYLRIDKNQLVQFSELIKKLEKNKRFRLRLD